MKHTISLSSLCLGFSVAFTAFTFAQDSAPAPAPAPAPAAQSPAPAPTPAPEVKPAEAKPAEAPAPAPESKPAVEAPAPVPAPAPEAAPARRFTMRGMVPMGYKDFITAEQKAQIYKIQDEYRPRFEDLEKQMMELRKEMFQKIEGVLTPEQLEKVRAREQEIRARRGLKNGEKQK